MFFLVSSRQLACLWLGESDGLVLPSPVGAGTLCSWVGESRGFMAVALRALGKSAFGCQERLLLSVLTVHFHLPFAF